MTFKFSESAPIRVPYRESITDPVTGRQIISGSTYNVLNEARNLSDSNVGGTLPAGVDAAVCSVFILDSFDFSVMKETRDENFSLASGDDLNQKTLENFDKTIDKNVTRDEKENFDALKPGTVSAAKVFDQRTSNSINELDQNISTTNVKLPKVSQDVVGLANDFLNYSPQRLTSRVRK